MFNLDNDTIKEDIQAVATDLATAAEFATSGRSPTAAELEAIGIEAFEVVCGDFDGPGGAAIKKYIATGSATMAAVWASLVEAGFNQEQAAARTAEVMLLIDHQVRCGLAIAASRKAAAKMH